MGTDGYRRFGRYSPILLWTLLLAGCTLVGLVARKGEEAAEKRPPRVVSTFNHAIHVAADMSCTDCHEGAEGEDQAGLPEIELCEGCHEIEDNEAYAKWVESEPKEDGSVVISREQLKGFRDVTAPHAIHYAGEVTCDICHGDIAESEKILENTILSKEMCMECHEGDFDCSDCHSVIRKTTKPSSHWREWVGKHGRTAVTESGSVNKRCILCHEESACHECHRTRRPASHGGGWKRFHGSEVDTEFELQENRCYFCHRQLDCKKCHKTESPSSHTASWRTRTHGLHAETDRDSCLVCHKQAYCSGCHRAAPPRPRDGAHVSGADCSSCHALLDHGTRSSENFECAKCHR